MLKQSVIRISLALCHSYIGKCQLSVQLPEGKRTIKRQLYSGPFTLREAGLDVALTTLYFAHSCTIKHRHRLLPSGSEATPHENYLYKVPFVMSLCLLLLTSTALCDPEPTYTPCLSSCSQRLSTLYMHVY